MEQCFISMVDAVGSTCSCTYNARLTDIKKLTARFTRRELASWTESSDSLTLLFHNLCTKVPFFFFLFFFTWGGVV